MKKLSKKDKATILIVDDMSTNIILLSDLLKDEYNIKVAKNGMKALDIVQKYDIDLILLDIVMPEIDGYEVCRRLKQMNKSKKIPIIFVTARDNDADEEFGLNLGAIDYITKPINKAIVKLRVKNHIELKLKSDLLEELSMYDGLTNIPNRRFFDDALQKAFKEAKRDDLSLSIMMLDIDFFKSYNDNYGHGKGDEALKRVAAALSSSLKRPTDLVARYGGEEFIILLKSIDENSLIQIANNIIEDTHKLDIPHEYSNSNNIITLSIGISYTFKVENCTKLKLLKLADEQLYIAKNKGRDRFAIKECKS